MVASQSDFKLSILALSLELDRSEAAMLAEFAKRGHHVEAIVVREGPGIELLRAAQIEVQRLSFRSRLDMKSVLALRKVVTKTRFDVVHCFSARTLTTALLAGLPGHTALVAYRGTVGRLGHLNPVSYISYFNRRVDAVICVSSAVKRFLQRYIDPRKLSVIYKGHDREWYGASEKKDLTEFGIPQGSYVITCIANDRPVKGIQFAVECLEYLPSDVHLLLIGRLTGAKKWVDKSPCKDRIHVTGFQKNPAQLLASSDALLVPSVAREGLPRVIIEGWSVNVPVIASAVGGIPEVIVDQHSGLLVPPRSPGELANAVAQLRRDSHLVARLVANGQQRINEKFSITITIDKTLALLKRCVASRAATPPGTRHVA